MQLHAHIGWLAGLCFGHADWFGPHLLCFAQSECILPGSADGGVTQSQWRTRVGWWAHLAGGGTRLVVAGVFAFQVAGTL